MLSVVPQGLILGLLLFLMHVSVSPDVATSTSVALFADDTKCYQVIKSLADGVCLQRALDNISQWCDFWQMDLNQSKCGLLSFARNTSLFHIPYQLSDVQVKTTEAQGLVACSKTNKMHAWVYPEVTLRQS